MYFNAYAAYFLATVELFFNDNRAFSITWTQRLCKFNYCLNLHKERVKFTHTLFGTPTWPLFHCFGTPIWPPGCHVKTFHREGTTPYLEILDILGNIFKLKISLLAHKISQNETITPEVFLNKVPHVSV